jgi:hypothetical protein
VSIHLRARQTPDLPLPSNKLPGNAMRPINGRVLRRTASIHWTDLLAWQFIAGRRHTDTHTRRALKRPAIPRRPLKGRLQPDAHELRLFSGRHALSRRLQPMALQIVVQLSRLTAYAPAER